MRIILTRQKESASSADQVVEEEVAFEFAYLNKHDANREDIAGLGLKCLEDVGEFKRGGVYHTIATLDGNGELEREFYYFRISRVVPEDEHIAKRRSQIGKSAGNYRLEDGVDAGWFRLV